MSKEQPKHGRSGTGRAGAKARAAASAARDAAAPSTRLFSPHRVERSDAGDAFIPDPAEGRPARVDSDDFAESLAEEFVEGATTGEDPDDARLERNVPEDIGGPFIETSASEEFARDVDANNPPGTEREPLPRANAEPGGGPDEEER